MNERLRYRLQRKEPYTMPNIIGNRSMPVRTFRWRDVALSNDKESLERAARGRHDLRVIDTLEGVEEEVTPDG